MDTVIATMREVETPFFVVEGEEQGVPVGTHDPDMGWTVVQPLGHTQDPSPVGETA